MITRDNLNDVVASLSQADKDRILNSNKEYCVLELHVFNAGSYTSIKLTNNFSRYQNVSNKGNVIMDISDVINIINYVNSWPDKSWLNGKYFAINAEINTSLPFISIGEYFWQGEEADNVISEIHKLWIKINCTQEEAIQMYCNMMLS